MHTLVTLFDSHVGRGEGRCPIINCNMYIMQISNVISKSERPLQKQNEEGISVENENVARFNRKISLHSVIEKISVNDPYTCRVTEQEKIYFPKCEISDSSPSHDKSKSSQKRHTRSYSEPESELSKIVQKKINSRPMAKHIDLALSFTDLRMRDGTQGDHVHIFKNRRELLVSNYCNVVTFLSLYLSYVIIMRLCIHDRVQICLIVVTLEAQLGQK